MAARSRTCPHPAATTRPVDYVYLQENLAGVVKEWWYHTPTAFWFIAERDTRTDTILKTYAASDVFKERVDFSAGPRE